MKWESVKEFFKPEQKKIIITIYLLLLTLLSYVMIYCTMFWPMSVPRPALCRQLYYVESIPIIGPLINLLLGIFNYFALVLFYIVAISWIPLTRLGIFNVFSILPNALSLFVFIVYMIIEFYIISCIINHLLTKTRKFYLKGWKDKKFNLKKHIVVFFIMFVIFLMMLYSIYNTPTSISFGYSSVKTRACEELIRQECDVGTETIEVVDFDADQDGFFGSDDTGSADWVWGTSTCDGDVNVNADNLAALCACYYGQASEDGCRQLCGCPGY